MSIRFRYAEAGARRTDLTRNRRSRSPSAEPQNKTAKFSQPSSEKSASRRSVQSTSEMIRDVSLWGIEPPSNEVEVCRKRLHSAMPPVVMPRESSPWSAHVGLDQVPRL